MVSSSGSVVSLCPFWGQKVSTVLALLRQVVREPRHRSLGQHVVQLLPQDQHLCWRCGYGVHDAIDSGGPVRYGISCPCRITFKTIGCDVCVLHSCMNGVKGRVTLCTKLETFDEIRLSEFESNALNIDLEKTPCISANAQTHIQSATKHSDGSMQLKAEIHGF